MAMSKNKLATMFNKMDTARYELVVGTGSANVLQQAFKRKRVVHPGINGRPLPPPESQRLWRETMQGAANSRTKRTAYIHIPFCSHLCLYCGFFQNYSDDERETIYINKLIKELEMARDSEYIQSGLFQAVFIGGGTPSALSPYNAGRLLQKIHECLPLSNDCELTLEARINDIEPAKLEMWFANGVNRISIGVQSFNTQLRQQMGRIDSREIVEERLRLAASYNQAAIIIDLIFGLPGQTVDLLLEDLAAVDSLPIDGMDLYQLNLFDVSPLKKAIDNGSIPPAATTAQQAELFAAAENWLSARNFRRLSNCHWAQSNRERSQYNSLTKQGAEVVPFGAGAGGNLAGKMMFLHRDIKVYMEQIEQGIKPLMFLAKQPERQPIHNEIMRQLELGYIDLSRLAEMFGSCIYELEAIIDIWEQNGLLTRGAAHISLTQAGRFWQMNMTQSLLECIEAILAAEIKPEVQRIAEQG